MTRIPTSVEDAKALAWEIIEKEGLPYWTKYTGLTEIPRTQEDLQRVGAALILSKGGAELAKITAGKITRIPTSLQDAAGLAREILGEQGMLYYTKHTGLTEVPKSNAEFQKMVTQLTLATVGDELGGLTNGLITRVPTTLDDAKLMAQQVIEKVALPYWTKYTGLSKIPMTPEDFNEMVGQLMAKKGGEELSALTGGLITMVPTSIDDAKVLADKIIKKKGQKYFQKWTGLSYVPSTDEDVATMSRNLVLKQGGVELSKLTGGVIRKIPSSLSEAKEIAKQVVKDKGMPFLTKYTGLTRIPKNQTELQGMVKTLALKKGGEELSRLTGGVITHIPTSVAEAKDLVMDIITKVGMPFFTKYTGLSTMPTNEAELATMAAELATKSLGESLSELTGGLITSVPGSVEEAKTMARHVIQTKGLPYYTEYTGFSTAPSTQAELAAMAKQLAAKQAGAELGKLTQGVITRIPTSLADAKEMAREIIQDQGGSFWTEYTGLTAMPTTQVRPTSPGGG